MRKISKILFLIIFLVFVQSSAFAQTKSPTPTTKPEPTIPEQSQIDDLKERIATRVAQLNLVEKRGIVGKVTESSSTQVTIEDLNGDARFIDVDELTKFSSSSSKAFGISDISEGDVISAIGIYNKQSRRLLARQISTFNLPTFIQGAVISTNEEEFNFVLGNTKEKFTVEVERITRTSSYDKDEELTKSGFSQIEVEQNVIVFGFLDENNKDTIIASRIIHFIDIPKNPLITIDTLKFDSPTIVPSTGSGRKLVPIVNE